MALVDAKCTNCGAKLSIDDSKDAAICEFCGSAFIVEKAINNFQINANVINVINTGSENDYIIRAGVLEKYNGSSIDVTLPQNVFYIGKSAFKNCIGLSSVKMHNQVSSIGENAFENCRSLKKIVIPDSVTKIEKNAFLGCSSLSNIIYNKKLEISCFVGSKYYMDYQKKRNRCPYCGGEYMGLIKKACQRCGRWKDYK